MRISCPNCQSVYQLAEGSLGATGRKVRCTRCGQIWHAKPGAEDRPPIEEDQIEADWAAAEAEAKAAAEALAEPSLDDWKSALTGGDDDEADAPRPGAGTRMSDDDFAPRPAHGGHLSEEDLAHDEPAPAAGPGAGEPVAAATSDGPVIEGRAQAADPSPTRRPIKVRPRKAPPSAARKLGAKIASSMVLTMAATTVAVTVGGALFARSAVVRMFPDMAGLYALVGLEVNLRGLDFVDVKTYREMDGGAPVLVVQGEIVNSEAGMRPVPTIRFGLRSSTGREVYAWTMEPSQRALEPAARLSFKSRLPSPPDAALDVQVRFTDRRTP